VALPAQVSDLYITVTAWGFRLPHTDQVRTHPRPMCYTTEALVAQYSSFYICVSSLTVKSDTRYNANAADVASSELDRRRNKLTTCSELESPWNKLVLSDVVVCVCVVCVRVCVQALLEDLKEACRGCSAALTAAVAFLDSRQLGMVALLDRQAKDVLRQVQVRHAPAAVWPCTAFDHQGTGPACSKSSTMADQYHLDTRTPGQLQAK